jgi:hypothetical protein
MRLELGKNYTWIFLVFATTFIILGFGSALLRRGYPEYAVALLPITTGFVIVSEIRSGIALDAWWRAKYTKEMWQYKALLAWHGVGLVVLTVTAIFFILYCPPWHR